VREEADKCWYRWIISDTGIGMSEEFLAHIFEPFAQEKNDARSEHQGSGLGMAIVKALIDQMGGTISVTSEVGVGSTFVIELPFDIAPAPKENESNSLPQENNIQGMHLMLVEDNALNAEIAETLLADGGAEITTVRNGKQAVELFQKMPSGAFDAILMDIMMPVMDGYEAAEIIRASGRDDAGRIPIIAMTANAFTEDKLRARKAGMNDHISKPVSGEKLIRMLSELSNRN